MNQIKALNQQLEVNSQEIESMISELVEREELLCTGYVCGVNIGACAGNA